MPKAIQYRTNSVIYFQGDVEDRVYIMQKGRIVLTSTDIATGERINETIKEGEFFGVKSALGHFPREETVSVLSDTIVLAFTASEFEAFAMTNTRIIMKMLKVFSNQLRKIHKQTEALLESTKELFPDEGLFSVGVAFFNSSKFSQSIDIFQRYIRTYPQGIRVAEATDYIKKASKKAPASPKMMQSLNASFAASQDSIFDDDADSEQDKFLKAQSLLTQKKYEEAYKLFDSITQETTSSLIPDALLGAGTCQYSMNEFDDAIKTLTKMIASSPRHPKMGEALLYIGLSYGKKNEQVKMQAFIKKAQSVADPELAEKIQRLTSSH